MDDFWDYYDFLVKKRSFEGPLPGNPKIYFLRSREVAVFVDVLVAGFL